MSSRIVPAIRAVVRDELAGRRGLELGVVTQVLSNDGGSGEHHLACHVRLNGSALELQQVPVSVGRLGVNVLPQVGNLVVLGFVAGDIDQAVVLGVLHDNDHPPPDAKPAELVYTLPDDADDGARRLHIELPSGHTLTLKDSSLEITLGSSKVAIAADGAISIEAGGDLTLKAAGALTLEGGSGAMLKAPKVTVQADAAATLKGATVSLAGNTSFSPS
jgi:phage baseplate assembly protein gpV